MSNIQGIPVLLSINNWPCLIVGGGAVAFRRAETLRQAGAIVTVVSPEIDARFDSSQVTLIAESFDLSRHPLSPYRWVILATDCSETHDRIAQAISQMPSPPLVNRADAQWEDSDITFMAAHCDGPITLGVHTGGVSASAAGDIRDDLVEKLDPAWAVILELASPYRHEIKQADLDPQTRRALLISLTDSAIRKAYSEGGTSAARERLDAIMERLA